MKRAMQRAWLIPLLLLLTIAGTTPQAAIATEYTDNLTITNQDLLDDDGWNYGVRFLVTNGYAERVCVYARIYSAQNVYGDVIHGPLLLQPYESNIAVGTFQAAEYGEAWNVHIQVKGDDSCYLPGS